MNEQDFTQGNIISKMLKFMSPVFAALILQAMYSAVDLLIVGHAGTSDAIAGVSTGSSVINLFTFTIAAFTTAVTVLIGQYIGAKRHSEIGETVGNALALFFVFAAVITAVLIIFAEPIALFMQAPKEALDVTVQYIRICGGGYVFIMLYNFISSIFRGFGDSKMPLVFVASACCVNIVADILFVIVFKMNVAGAAAATVIAQAFSVFISFIIIRKKSLFPIKAENIRFGPKVKLILKVGAPLAVMEVLKEISFLALCAFVNHIGLDAASGYGVAQKVTSFIMLLPSSLLQCMTPFVSQNVGAGLEKRAKKGMYCGIMIGVVVGAAIWIIIWFFGEQISLLFTGNIRYAQKAYEYLIGFVPDAIITSISFSFCGYFSGHTKSVFVMIQGLIQSLAIRLPIAYAASIVPGISLMYIGMAVPAASIAGVIMCLIYYFYLNKKEKLILQ